MDMSLVQFSNNNPETLGWPANTGFVPYTWTDPKTGTAYLFPQGVYEGTGPIWDDLLNAIVPLIGIPGAQGIHPGGFGVAGTWGAENRDNVNSPGTTSFHGCARALDINAPWNANGTGPQDGQPWGVPAAVGPIARSKGFLWGGDFQGTSDPMHFELHLTDAEIAICLAELASPAVAPTPAPTPGDELPMDQPTFNKLMDGYLDQSSIPVSWGPTDPTPPISLRNALTQLTQQTKSNWVRLSGIAASLAAFVGTMRGAVKK